MGDAASRPEGTRGGSRRLFFILYFFVGLGGRKSAARPGLGPVLLCCGGCMGVPPPARRGRAGFGGNGVKNAAPPPSPAPLGCFRGGWGCGKAVRRGRSLPLGGAQPGSGVSGRIWGDSHTFGAPQAGGSAVREVGSAGAGASSAIPIPRMTPSFCQFLPASFPPPFSTAGSRPGPPFPGGSEGVLGAPQHPGGARLQGGRSIPPTSSEKGIF